MNDADYKELKKGGMMRQAEKGKFSVRLRIAGGRLTAEAMGVVQGVAERYGRGEIHLTARQGIEIPNVNQDDLFKVKSELAAGGVKVGVCGPTVRTVTACQGSRVCPRGVLDASGLADEVDRLFYGKPVPTKFKVSISGCVNNCLKAEENDIGVKGGSEPGWNKNSCTYCGVCEAVCPADAIRVSEEEGRVHIDLEKCIYCGDCINACPFGAMFEARRGFFVFAGGKFGRFPSLGRKIGRFFSGDSSLISIVRASIEFFRNYGTPRERFGNTIQRVGFEEFEKYVLDAIEDEKDEKAARHNR
jgi:dissimilatory sulfite reductase (desulfoviridin) alpha/beta subunit